MNSLISSDNIWVLWTFLVVWSAISIVLEQKYKWASKVTGAIIALLGAIIFENLKISDGKFIVNNIGKERCYVILKPKKKK